MAFTEEEAAFLSSPSYGNYPKTGCIATVAADGQPDVVGVSYEFDGTYLYIGGLNQLVSRKYRNVKAGHEKVAIFIDHMDGVRPDSLQWMRIYGTADLVERKGRFDSKASGAAVDRESSTYIRITPVISWGFNLSGKWFEDTEGFDPEKFKNRASVVRNNH
ncbi:pyridoxamine 5'-phosphate oxidase family protein [Streptomyces sp. NPDC004237]|uniref:pyridoxamine 5'-phosphate oxidase family protein n=1 Tax=Streptomyces sp. NPDC004237 TaxID=3154455 RepID=UPI0033A73061